MLYVCVCRIVYDVVVVVGWLTASMLAAMLVARAVSTGLCIGFYVVSIRLCVCLCVYRGLLRYDYVFQWHRCRYTFGNLCFIIKDTYMKHK